MTRAMYHIRVSGTLPAELLTELGSLDVIVAPAETVLCGSLPHQSALFALIRRIDSLGLLCDEEKFRRAAIDPVSNAITWEGELTLDPDALYRDVASQAQAAVH